MKSKEWLDWKKNWPVFVLVILFVPTLWWWRIWSSGVLLKWWQVQEGQLSLPTFFQWEEFIALHSHQNEWPGRVGFYLIILLVIFFILLSAIRIIKTEIKVLLVPFILTMLLLFFSICLCQSEERSNRKFCLVNLKNYHSALMNHAADYGFYPTVLPDKEETIEKYRPHSIPLKNRNYLFPGAGRKIEKERFIVIEDTPRTHAGDLRHRLWSDGTIDFYYPWKARGDVK